MEAWMTNRRHVLARWRFALGLLALLTLTGSGCSTQSVSSSSSTASGAGDVRTLPAGEAVILAEKSVPGKVTIFDFYAEWCLPCALITPELEKLVQKRPDELALRKVDVIGWGSDAAMHQNIEYLPYLAVVDADGNIAAVGDESYTYLKDRYGLDLVDLLTS
jgi:thiol-disulfide isomerase/thioredoxin